MEHTPRYVDQYQMFTTSFSNLTLSGVVAHLRQWKNQRTTTRGLGVSFARTFADVANNVSQGKAEQHVQGLLGAIHSG